MYVVMLPFKEPINLIFWGRGKRYLLVTFCGTVIYQLKTKINSNIGNSETVRFLVYISRTVLLFQPYKVKLSALQIPKINIAPPPPILPYKPVPFGFLRKKQGLKGCWLWRTILIWDLPHTNHTEWPDTYFTEQFK